MKKLIASTILAAGLYGLAGTAYAADCGDVSIAEMNWASAGVAAQVDKIILHEGYGCNVTLVTGDTQPTFASMDEKGVPDMAPELWVNAVRTSLDKAVSEGRLIEAAPLLSDGGVEGWWIPKFLADAHPDIKTVQDALKHPELFPAPEDPSKGAVTNCPSGWNCQISTANLYKALGADKLGFTLVDTGSAAGLDGSIANAFEKKTGWFGYYWAAHRHPRQVRDGAPELRRPARQEGMGRLHGDTGLRQPEGQLLSGIRRVHRRHQGILREGRRRDGLRQGPQMG